MRKHLNKIAYAILLTLATPAMGTNNGSNTSNDNSLNSYNRIDTKNTNVGINTNLGVNENYNKNLNSNIGINNNKAYGGNARSSSNSISNSKSISSGGNSYATAGSAYSGGNTQNVTVGSGGDIRYGGSYRVESVGVAPDMVNYSTAPCRIAVGVSGGWIGGALGLSGSILDEGCDIWRDSENLVKAGYKEAADTRLCDKAEIKKLLPHCNAMNYTVREESNAGNFQH